MVNVFRLRSIIDSLYGQVAGDLETCSRLWRIMSPRAEEADRTTNNVHSNFHMLDSIIDIQM